jgi:hypothetical protein
VTRENRGETPTPPGNADGCEKKGFAGKAIRICMKTKGDGKWRVASDEWRAKANDYPPTPGDLEKEAGFA